MPNHGLFFPSLQIIYTLKYVILSLKKNLFLLNAIPEKLMEVICKLSLKYSTFFYTVVALLLEIPRS